MITFFIILAVLMVLVFAAGTWSSGGWGGPRGGGGGRRVIYDREPVAVRRPRERLGEEIVEEEWEDTGARPRSRRVVRRRQL